MPEEILGSAGRKGGRWDWGWVGHRLWLSQLVPSAGLKRNEHRTRECLWKGKDLGELRENTSIDYDHGVFTWEGSTVWGPQCLS